MSSYWVTLKKGENTEIKRGSTRSICVENSLRKRLWNSRKTDE
jgi:hypothetical protein